MKTTDKCEECLREFPKHLLNSMVTHSQRYNAICPICALKIRNAAHGLPSNTPFNGEKAQAAHAEALKYLKGS